MTGISHAANQATRPVLPWTDYSTLRDVGTAGVTRRPVARFNPHPDGVGFDLPEWLPISRPTLAIYGVSECTVSPFSPRQLLDHDSNPRGLCDS